MLFVSQVASALGIDSDGDGVDDSIDVCCQTQAGVPVDAEGRPIGDLDQDCDVDLEDHKHFQNSLRGPASQSCCEDSDCDDQDDCTIDTCDLAIGCTHLPRATAGPLQSSPVAISCDGTVLVNVNSDANSITVFDATQSTLVKIAEVPVGRDPRSVAVLGSKAFVANAFDGTLSVVDLSSFAEVNTISVGAEPMAVAPSANGSWVYVANSASNNMMTINVETGIIVHTTDLSGFGSSPRAIAVTNDGDLDDTDETIFVAMFYGQLRPGKTSTEEGQDDQREGRVVAISGATLSPLGAPNPIVLAPQANTGFNSNGKLAPAPGQVPSALSTNPQTFTTPTGAYPNQLAAIALHPTSAFGYVVSTGASPNGPLRFNSMNQGLVSVFGIPSRTEATAAQTDPNVRRTAPLNLNQGVNLATTPAPRLFMTNPVAMAWRPDGADAWIAIQNSDVVVRATVDANGIPTVNAPLVAGPSSIVRVDLRSQAGLQTESEVPQGIAINPAGTRAYVSNLISRSVTTIDISNATAPSIVGSVRSTDLPTGGTQDALAHLGASLFYTGRGPQGRMASESWGGCILCHPSGRSDNVTWMFDAGPRQTIPLDGMFDKSDPTDQRILNWSAVRDENHDFELNTRGVFGGRGLIDDDRLFFAMGGASGATPTDINAIAQFQQVTGVVGTTNDLAAGATLPTIIFARRDFASATLPDGRVFLFGGRFGSGAGTLVPTAYSTIEFNPRENTLTLRNGTGFTLRHSLGAAVVQTSQGVRIYAVGGYTATPDSASPVNTVEEYNPATNSWRTVASLPTAVAQFGITVAGGVNTAEPLQLIHVVSGNTGQSLLRPLPMPAPSNAFRPIQS
jgi:YVTN family beta-propeller protein